MPAVGVSTKAVYSRRMSPASSTSDGRGDLRDLERGCVHRSQYRGGVDDPSSSPAARRTRLTLGVLGCLTLLSVGWTGLLIPSLIRSIESTFGQTDAGIGVVYLVYAIAYMSGSFAGGTLTERLGRRIVLGGAVLIHAAGIAGFGLAPGWEIFVVAALVAGFGAGALDGGANGLVLDVYREGRGRAMNLLHMSFSIGALAAPLIVGTLVEAACRGSPSPWRRGRSWHCWPSPTP